MLLLVSVVDYFFIAGVVLYEFTAVCLSGLLINIELFLTWSYHR